MDTISIYHRLNSIKPSFKKLTLPIEKNTFECIKFQHSELELIYDAKFGILHKNTKGGDESGITYLDY